MAKRGRVEEVMLGRKIERNSPAQLSSQNAARSFFDEVMANAGKKQGEGLAGAEKLERGATAAGNIYAKRQAQDPFGVGAAAARANAEAVPITEILGY
jgi:hypothetical protein